jgi:hypothetical protein
MRTPLDSVAGTVLCGVALTVVLWAIVRLLLGGGAAG